MESKNKKETEVFTGVQICNLYNLNKHSRFWMGRSGNNNKTKTKEKWEKILKENRII